MHDVLLFDNSGDEPRLILEMAEGVVITQTPDWAASLLSTRD